jgi:hypothetical protein
MLKELHESYSDFDFVLKLTFFSYLETLFSLDKIFPYVNNSLLFELLKNFSYKLPLYSEKMQKGAIQMKKWKDLWVRVIEKSKLD